MMAKPSSECQTCRGRQARVRLSRPDAMLQQKPAQGGSEMRNFRPVKHPPFPVSPASPRHHKDTGRACSHPLSPSSIAGGCCPGTSPAGDTQGRIYPCHPGEAGPSGTWGCFSTQTSSSNYSTETRFIPASPGAPADQIASHAAVLGGAEHRVPIPASPSLHPPSSASRGCEQRGCSPE